MICSTCLQETGDVTAHICPGPPRGIRLPRGSSIVKPGALNSAQIRLVREIVREELTPCLRARIDLGELETDAERRIRDIIREEMTKRFGLDGRIREVVRRPPPTIEEVP